MHGSVTLPGVDRYGREAECDSMNEQVVLAVDRERRRLAQELHDDIGNRFAAIAVLAEACQAASSLTEEELQRYLREIRTLALEGLDFSRTIGRWYMPPPLRRGGLIGAMRSLVEAFTLRFAVPVSLDLDPGLPDPDRDAATAIYRIAQEALSNAGRHSRASQVQVHVRMAGPYIRLDVKDDGCGFYAEQHNGGQGLDGLGYWARLAGGAAVIRSRPGKGTHVLAWVPAGQKATPSRALLHLVED